MLRLGNRLATVLAALLTATASVAQQVEYFWDDDPGIGKGLLLQSFEGTSATLTADLDASGLMTGVHQLGLRALNGDYWSATYYRSFYVLPAEEHISRIEYSWDAEMPLGEGTPLAFSSGDAVELTELLSTASLSAGLHRLFIRALSDNHHSMTYVRSFYVLPVPHEVEAVEYFFDADPGVGNATWLAATTTDGLLALDFDVSTEGLTQGIHHIGLRTLTNATWSSTYYRQFLVATSEVTEGIITRIEYFIDDDPGQGVGQSVPLSPGAEVAVEFMADVSSLTEGEHAIGLRARTSNGSWSSLYTESIVIEKAGDDLQEYLNSFDDSEDLLTQTNYTRQFLNTDWQSLYVPFTLSYEDWNNDFEVARLSDFHSYDDNGDGKADRQELVATLLTADDGNIEANTPYLIRAKKKGTHTFNVGASRMVDKQITTNDYASQGAVLHVTGNYADLKSLKTGGQYRLIGGSLWIPSSDDDILKPCRWYATIANGTSVRSIVLRINDGTTSVSYPMSTLGGDELVGSSRGYDLSGRRIRISNNARLSSLSKGIYIIDNRKVIVK